jgi:DNA polymerase-3 subunit epsilon
VSAESKRLAVKWARTLLEYGRDLLIFDTETTAADPTEAELVELGVINGVGEVVYQMLVRPENPIPTAASDIHGITDEMVANAPTPGPVLASFHVIVSEHVALAAYNYQYDSEVIFQAGVGHPQVGARPTPSQKACVMKIWSYWHGDYDPQRASYRWVKLTEAAAEAGLDTSGAHRAIDDCMMTLGLLWWLAREDAV